MTAAAFAPLLPDSAPHTTSTLSYATPPADGSVPYNLLYAHDTMPETNLVYAPHSTPLYDLRTLVNEGREAETNVDVTGFQIVPAALSGTKLSERDWDNDETIRGTYYDEVTDLLKKTLGASKVIIFDHTIRKVEAAGEETPDTPESRKPVTFVHIDQTPASGTARVHRHATSPEEAEHLLAGRAQLINVWRPIRGPVQDRPLAYADARTLNPSKDLMKARLIYKDAKEGETFSIAHNPEHRWYYLSEMGPQEAVLLKCWENKEGAARTPHTGCVDDKYIGVKTDGRQSIEVRALVFHEV